MHMDGYLPVMQCSLGLMSLLIRGWLTLILQRRTVPQLTLRSTDSDLGSILSSRFCPIHDSVLNRTPKDRLVSERCRCCFVERVVAEPEMI